MLKSLTSKLELKSRFKRFDAHRKAKAEVQSQTISGALITICSVFIVFSLIISEYSSYLRLEYASHMIPDKTVGFESIDIQFSLSFKSIKCDKLSFQQSVTRGTLHTHDEGKIIKSPLKIDNNHVEGCTLEGSILVDKVDGNFRFMIKPEFDSSNSPTITRNGQHMISISRPQIKPIDLSHQVHYLRFIPRDISDYDDVDDQYPTDIQNTFTTELINHDYNSNNDPNKNNDNIIGVYNYGVRAVTIHEQFLNRTLKHTTQLSVLNREISLSLAGNGISIAGYPVHNEIGILFSYDFYPIMLETIETRAQTLFQFLTGLCAILGGTITVLGLLDRIVHESTKSLLGKQD